MQALERLAQLKKTNKLGAYKPYIKQREFHAAGKDYRERLFMAGNQLGKTIGGGFEAAIHATGLYPNWWQGKIFEKPTFAWASSVTGESTRNNPQRILMGHPQEFGTGAIPKDCIADYTNARGIPDLLDNVLVKHVTGGISRIWFKSYNQGREKWQGDTLHWVWYDEEPPPEIYSEGLTRTNTTKGIAFTTFTPLLGMTEVVRSFLLTPTADRHVTRMTIDDAEHYTPEERARIVAAYPEWEREARARGEPTMGSGRIFPVAEEIIKVDAFPIPAHWVQIGGMDFGWDHPFAAVRLAWDRDNDCVYVVNALRMREKTPVMHAAALRSWGDWLPWAWPHDGLQHSKDSGEPLKEQYKANGLNMLFERATYQDGSSGVEAGIMDMLDRMQTGRLRVFSHLNEWFEEFRLYHRKDGKVAKEADDLLCAARYGIMSLRHATTQKSTINYHELYG